jgi:hypothetical protein
MVALHLDGGRDLTVAGPSVETSTQGIEVQFEPLREGWSVYKVKDESIIRLKLLLMKLFLQGMDETTNARFGAVANTFFTVTAPSSKKGPRSDRTFTPAEVLDAITEEDIEFEMIREEWNEYKLPENVIISAKLVLTQVSRTGLYDAYGDPMFRIQHQTLVKAKIPKEAVTMYLQMLQKPT